MVKSTNSSLSHSSIILTVDVGHPPLPADRVEEILLDAWTQVRNSLTLRLLKVIHGYGSSGKGGTTREVVRNWAFAHRAKFRGVIEGEGYVVFDHTVQEMRKEIGLFPDSDLDTANPGITVIWVK